MTKEKYTPEVLEGLYNIIMGDEELCKEYELIVTNVVGSTRPAPTPAPLALPVPSGSIKRRAPRKASAPKRVLMLNEGITTIRSKHMNDMYSFIKKNPRTTTNAVLDEFATDTSSIMSLRVGLSSLVSRQIILSEKRTDGSRGKWYSVNPEVKEISNGL